MRKDLNTLTVYIIEKDLDVRWAKAVSVVIGIILILNKPTTGRLA